MRTNPYDTKAPRDAQPLSPAYSTSADDYSADRPSVRQLAWPLLLPVLIIVLLAAGSFFAIGRISSQAEIAERRLAAAEAQLYRLTEQQQLNATRATTTHPTTTSSPSPTAYTPASTLAVQPNREPATKHAPRTETQAQTQALLQAGWTDSLHVFRAHTDEMLAAMRRSQGQLEASKQTAAGGRIHAPERFDLPLRSTLPFVEPWKRAAKALIDRPERTVVGMIAMPNVSGVTTFSIMLAATKEPKVERVRLLVYRDPIRMKPTELDTFSLLTPSTTRAGGIMNPLKAVPIGGNTFRNARVRFSSADDRAVVTLKFTDAMFRELARSDITIPYTKGVKPVAGLIESTTTGFAVDFSDGTTAYIYDDRLDGRLPYQIFRALNYPPLPDNFFDGVLPPAKSSTTLKR
jgi:hypothetical protein